MTSDLLRWNGSTADQLSFMRRVYEEQIARAARVRSFTGDLQPELLSPVEGSFLLRPAAASACQQLLKAARDQLAADKTGPASEVVSVGLSRTYRSASEQFQDWMNNFPRFYAETASSRQSCADGEHGETAVAETVRYVAARQAAPGFGIHNQGLAIDVHTVEGDLSLDPSADPASPNDWKRTWLAGWLTQKSAEFGFGSRSDGTDAWHLDYIESSAARTEALDLDQAAQANSRWSARLGWNVDDIASWLGLDRSPDATEFAQVIAKWQADQGLANDGIVGPQTWNRLQQVFGSFSPIPVTAAPAPAEPAPSEPLAGPVWQSVAAVDLPSAVQANNYWSMQLGWTYGDVARWLGLSWSPSLEDFAQVVAQWQATQGLYVDGILGPETWARMQQAFAVPSAPTVVPAQPQAAPATIAYPLGLDLSHWNRADDGSGRIDWNRLAGDPQRITFVYHKATDGNRFTDPDFARRWSDLAASRIFRGPYHFFRGWASGVDQANYFLRVLRAAGTSPTDLPPMLDLENPDDEPFTVTNGGSADPTAIRFSYTNPRRPERSWSMTADEYLAQAEAWLAAVQQATRMKPVVYTARGYWRQWGNSNRCSSYPLWVAFVAGNGNPRPESPPPRLFGGWKDWAIWQYSWRGQIQGIAVQPGTGNQVDMDRYNGPTSDFANREGRLFPPT